MPQRKPTHAEAQEINEILAAVTYDTAPHFGNNWKRAATLCYELTGYKPPGVCTSCRHAVHDRLREAVGLGIARRPKESERNRRIAICHACPVYRPSTRSCGRFGNKHTPFVEPDVVLLDGVSVVPCGCLIELKATFTSEQCPAKKW